MKGNFGFTLIELIVTTTIILLISTAVAVTFTGTNSKARDGRRMADLGRIRTALELHRQQLGYYPLDTGGTAALMPDFLSSWPTDPKSFSYFYDVGGSYTYTLDAHMEDVGSTTGSYGMNCGDDGAGGGGGGIDAAAECNYRVTNP